MWNRRGISYHDGPGIWGVVLPIAAIALGAVLFAWFPLFILTAVLALAGFLLRERIHRIAYWVAIVAVMGSVGWHWSEFREHEYNPSEWASVFIRANMADFLLPGFLTPENLEWNHDDGRTTEVNLQRILADKGVKGYFKAYLWTLAEGGARGMTLLFVLACIGAATAKGVRRWLLPSDIVATPGPSVRPDGWRMPALLGRAALKLCLIVLAMVVGLACWVMPRGGLIEPWMFADAWIYWRAWLLAPFVPDTVTLAVPGAGDGRVAFLSAIRGWEPYGKVSAVVIGAIWDWVLVVVPPMAALATLLFGYPLWRRERRLAWGASFEGLGVDNPWERHWPAGWWPWGRSQYRIAGKPWPKGAELRHTLVTGGALKDEVIRDLLAQIRKRGDKAIILDGPGDYAERFYVDGRDTILDPADERGTGLDIFGQAATEQEFGELAKTLIPELEKARDPEWTAKARELFTAVATAMSKQGDRDPAALVRHLTESDAGELTALIEGAGVQTPSCLADYASISTAKALLRPHLEGIPLETGHSGGDSGGARTPFSFRKWLDEPGSGGFVFVPGGEGGNRADAMAGMLRSAMETLCSFEKDASRRIWLVAPHGRHHLSAWLADNIDEISRSGGCVLEGRVDERIADDDPARHYATRLLLPPGNSGWESWKFARLLELSVRDEFQMTDYEALPPFDGFLTMPESTIPVPVRVSASHRESGGLLIDDLAPAATGTSKRDTEGTR